MVEEAGFAWVLRANPMYWLIDGYREVMIYGSAPDWTTLGRFALVAALLLAAGSSFFMAQKPRFPDLL
jgi:ABC-type polysaccharide/polyol phosphate export permease